MMKRKVMAVLVAVGGMGAVLSGYVAGRAVGGVRAVEVMVVPAVTPAPTPTGVMRVTPLQQMGQQLMECREKQVATRCLAGSEECAKARASLNGDGLFWAISGRTKENEFDIVARVDAALVTCARETGTFYQQKVW